MPEGHADPLRLQPGLREVCKGQRGERAERTELGAAGPGALAAGPALGSQGDCWCGHTFLLPTEAGRLNLYMKWPRHWVSERKLPAADLQPELQMESPAWQWTWGLQGDLWASSGAGFDVMPRRQCARSGPTEHLCGR